MTKDNRSLLPKWGPVFLGLAGISEWDWIPMPEIQAFRGIRYDLGHVGSLSDVIAPPYDVISPELQASLYKKHPCNVVRLILNRIEPGDDEVNNRYSRAKRFYQSWLAEGVLFREADPAIYVYYQEFEVDGRRYLRRGFMARVRLSAYGEGQIFPHEHTLRGPRMDQLMLMTMCKANLSQVFGMYPDPDQQTIAILDEAVQGLTPIEAVDHLGVIHRMWPVTDPRLVTNLSAVVGPAPIFIADGHHRYETALEYREQLRDMGYLRPDHPAHYVLMHCVPMEDPGLIVLPTHRLFRSIPPMTAAELAERLGDLFSLHQVANGPEAARDVWELVEASPDPATLAIFTRPDQQWSIAELTPAGREKMDDIATDHTPEWRALGVAVLHRLVVEHLLKLEPPLDIDYVHSIEEVILGLQTSNYPMAVLVKPASVKDIRDVSLQGDRMPAKSTYFYPKLCSGLVINPLE
ncbi:MAG TPA: DUF1015 domain-containing protein [Thermogutta sp.]|nr:DUF1015 domain-containing protein [Thermogutta sp.]